AASADVDSVHVACPLHTAPGDSQMNPGRFYRVEVLLKLPPGNTAVPICNVNTLDERDAESDVISQQEFTFDAASSRLIWASPRARTVARRSPGEGWPSVYLNCALRPGTGVIGAVTTQSIGAPGQATPAAAAP